MISSGGKESCRHDKANGAGSRRKQLLTVTGLVVLVVLVALAFVGYRQPELLLDYINLRYCG